MSAFRKTKNMRAARSQNEFVNEYLEGVPVEDEDISSEWEGVEDFDVFDDGTDLGGYLARRF